MNQAESSLSSRRRLETLFGDLVDDLRAFIRRQGVSYEDYHRAVEFLAQEGTGGEVPLLVDVFPEAVVDNVNYRGRIETEICVEGPYYASGASLLEPPYVLPQLENEGGEILFLSGDVGSAHGGTLVGALLDLWQVDAKGMYSQFNYQQPRHNLRCL